MQRRGIGTYLAQGASANAAIVYVLMLGCSLNAPSGPDMVMLIAVPVYVLIGAVPGAVVGSLFWLAEVVIGRRLGIVVRAATAIVLPTLIVIIVSLAFDLTTSFLPIILAAVAILTITLPAALLSGSRFNPLRRVVLGLESISGFGDKVFFPFGVFLRFASVLGMAEVIIFLTTLPARSLWQFTFGGDGFGEAIVVFFYFAMTGAVSFGLSQKLRVTLAAAVFLNVPAAIWAAQPERYLAVGSKVTAISIWILIGLWIPFVAGRVLTTEAGRRRSFRIMPVTLFEIRIRHALNKW